MRLTEEGMKRRDALQALAQRHGIESLRQLCVLSGVAQSNLYSNFNGMYDISLKRMFKLANALHVDILEVVKAFYPEMYAENEANKIPVE